MANRNYNLTEVKTEASDFLNDKKKKNNTTFLNYRTSINYFIYYLENIAEVEVLGTENKDKLLEGFQASLFDGFNYKVGDVERVVKVKASGVNTHIRRIKTFLNRRLGLTVELGVLKVSKPKYKSLSKKEVELLIAECSNKWSNEEVAVRNETLIRFLYNTAFRIEEALGIKTSDVYSKDNKYYVKIHEKGKAKEDETEVAISEGTYNLIQDYIKIKKVPSEYVFSSVKGNQFKRQNFNRSIKDLASYVDLKYKGTKVNDKPVNISKIIDNNSSHVFRHSKLSYLLRVKKEDVVTVQKVARHTSLNSTLVYLNPEEEAIDNVRINNDI